MSLLFVFFPLFNFFYAWISDFFLGKRKAILIIAHSYLIIIFIGFILFWKICIYSQFSFLTIGTWINCGLFVVNWGFIFDSLSVSMLLMVSIVSGAVHFYSIGY